MCGLCHETPEVADFQSELDAFLAGLPTHGADTLVSDRALAKPRSGLHTSSLCAFNGRLTDALGRCVALHIFEGRRPTCTDRTLHAPAQRAGLRTRSLAAAVHRALGLYLRGTDLVLHMAIGTELEGE